MQGKINIVNKKASFKYFLLKKYIAGLVLSGSEIKSIRLKKANIDRSFCTFFNNELYANNILIESYVNSSSFEKENVPNLSFIVNIPFTWASSGCSPYLCPNKNSFLGTL